MELASLEKYINAFAGEYSELVVLSLIIVGILVSQRQFIREVLAFADKKHRKMNELERVVALATNLADIEKKQKELNIHLIDVEAAWKDLDVFDEHEKLRIAEHELELAAAEAVAEASPPDAKSAEGQSIPTVPKSKIGRVTPSQEWSLGFRWLVAMPTLVHHALIAGALIAVYLPISTQLGINDVVSGFFAVAVLLSIPFSLINIFSDAEFDFADPGDDGLRYLWNFAYEAGAHYLTMILGFGMLFGTLGLIAQLF